MSMRTTKLGQILTVIFLSLTLLCLWITPEAADSGFSSTDLRDPSLVCRKNEIIEVGYSPMGDLISEMLRVKLEVHNNSSSPAYVDIRDRAECIDTSTLAMLYGAPYPRELETFGNTTIIAWNNVTIAAEDAVEYQYMVQASGRIPIVFNETIYVNGNRSTPRKIGKIYALDANISDTLTFQVTIRNVEQSLFTGRKSLPPPILCTVTAVFSDDYFSDLTTNPEANSTSTVAGRSMVAWIIFLNDSVTLNLSAKVKAIGPWGEVPIEPFTIQLEAIPEKMVNEIERSIEKLQDSIETLDDYVDMLEVLSRFIARAREIVGDLKSQINELTSEKADLEDQLLVIKNQKKPYSLEVYNATIQHKLARYEVDFSFEKLWPTRTRPATRWSVRSIEVTNTGNSTEVIQGLALQLRDNQSVLKPKNVLVFISGEWQEFDIDLAQLGLTYDSTKGTLYLWPRIVVNASDSSNVLVDWAGRPIQLIVESENKPEVYYVIDSEERCCNLQVDPVESQITCSVTQPHVLAQNLTFPEYTPPPPPQEEGWIQILESHSWLIGIPALGLASLAIILISTRRRRKIKPVEKGLIAKEEIETESLLKEIEDLRKTLENKE